MKPFRKLSANFIFDGESRVIRNGILTLDDAGRVVSLRQPGEGSREEAGVEFYNGILTPGFVNAHCHLELSHMKGRIEPGTGLPHFIAQVIANRKAPHGNIEFAMKSADNAMRKEGIVAVGDISNTDHSFAVKAGSAIRYHSFIELFGLGEGIANSLFTEGTHLAEKAGKEYGLSASLTPHSSYAVSETLFRKIAGSHANMRLPLSVHNQESKEENRFIRSARGKLYQLYKNPGWI